METEEIQKCTSDESTQLSNANTNLQTPNYNAVPTATVDEPTNPTEQQESFRSTYCSII